MSIETNRFMSNRYILFVAFLLLGLGSQAQVGEKITANRVIQGVFLGEVPSIAEQLANGTFVPADNRPGEVNPKRSDANRVVPGKGFPVGNDPLWEAGKHPLHTSPSYATRDPLLIFQSATPNATPTDPTGAVGPNHYVTAFNSAFRIFQKDGTPLTGSASLATIWPGQSSGDPIVMYDAEADRFFISQFFFNGFLVAVSTGPDPLNDGWYTYQYSTDSFPDYPKYSIWSDGYYVTANKNSGSAQTSDVVYCMDRETILAGDPAPNMIAYSLPGIQTSGFYSPLGFSVQDGNHPPEGNAQIIYLQDDAWGGVSDDHLKIWTINTNWDNPGSSTIELSQELITENFDSVFDGGGFSNIPQPSGPDIDCLQATIMYMASYRRFPSYNAVVVNHAVDLDGSDDLSGIRWYELRQDMDGGDWYIYQEGTYSQPDGHSAFSGSMAIDSNGNIGLGYTVCSSSLAPSLRYTGRYASDPLGEMTVEEGIFTNNGASDPSFRYGDYSQMTMDPADDKTFWFVGEHFVNNGNRSNTVGTFKLAPTNDIDVGVVDITAPVDGLLSAGEDVTIVVSNFGLLTQSNIPVYYSIDGGTPVMEVVPGPIASQNNVQYTFTVQGDFGNDNTVYTIAAGTELTDDQDENNDDYSENVTHLLADDVGVASITAPVSANGLGMETVTVVLENFGGATQTNVDVEYSIDGGGPVSEVYPGPIAPLSTETFSFSTQGDFSAFGDYTIVSETQLDTDGDQTNDAATTDVTHSFCQPGGDCSLGDGFDVFELEQINNASGCDNNGYGDYTDLVATVNQGENLTLTVTMGYGDQHVYVWIDFNDDFQFTNDELIVADYVVAPGQNAGTYTENIPFPIPADAPLGQHLMRAKAAWQTPPSEPCEASEYGETEDYTVDMLPVGVNESAFGDSEMEIASLGEGQFVASLETTATTEVLTFQLIDVTGRVLMENRIPYAGGLYSIPFDLSHAPAGAYLIRLGNQEVSKVKRVVKR